MTEWKELKIDKLPDFTKPYVFEMYDKRLFSYCPCYWTVGAMIEHLIAGSPLYNFTYKELRKPEITTKDLVEREMKCVADLLSRMPHAKRNVESTTNILGGALLLLLQEKYRETR